MLVPEDIDKTISGNTEGAILAGRYRVVRQLGAGGMGSVWLAEDTQLDNKLFAIKMLPSILVSNKRAYRQLKDEALVAMRLVHPNIVQIRAFEENNGNPFLVMDYIEGETLDDYLAEHWDVSRRDAEAQSGRAGTPRPPQGGLPESDVIRILKPIAAALDYAHSKGVVHRDVKPGNVMIAKDGHPYILDFGIAREIQETMTRVTGKLSSGTLLYMSPEQLNGAPPSSSQDIYSFAAMVYECLNSEPPFSRGQIEHQILNNPPPPLPEGLRIRDSIMRCLAKTPQSRLRACSDLFVLTTRKRVCPDQHNYSLPWWKLRFRGVMGLLALYFGIGAILVGMGFGLHFITEKRIETAKKSDVERRQEESNRKAENQARQREEEKQARERELTLQKEEETFTVYVVLPGDYLAKISKKYNVPLSSLTRLNPELENGVLRIGQRIKLPGKIEIGAQVDSAPATKSVKTYASYVGPVTEYVVKEGDSLAGIAYRNGINLRQIRELNGLSDHATIQVGQILKVPNKSKIVSDEKNDNQVRSLTDDQIKALLTKDYNGATAFNVDVPPKPKQTIKPDYPESSRKRGEEGDVALEFSVNRNGGVDRVFVLRSSGFPDLDDAAVQAVKSAEFDPAKSGDMPVSSVARLTLSFKLRDSVESSSDVGGHNTLAGSWSCSTTLTGSKWMSEMEYKYVFNENGFYTSRLVGNAITGRTKGEKTIITAQGNWSMAGNRLTLRCKSFSVNDNSPVKPKEPVYTYNVLWKKDGTFELRQANLEKSYKNGIKITYTYDPAGREISHRYSSAGKLDHAETAKIFRRIQ